MEIQKAYKTQDNLKDKVTVIMLPDFNTYYKT